MKLPKELFVHVEEGQSKDDDFLAASQTLYGAAPKVGEMRTVGRYRLIETIQIEQVTHITQKKTYK